MKRRIKLAVLCGAPMFAASSAVASPTLTTVATFTSATENECEAGLTFDAAGNLFGTSYNGGSSQNGTVFEVAAGMHIVSAVVAFNGSNGQFPAGAITVDASGNLYGTTSQDYSANYGNIFEIAAGTNALTTVASFTGTNGKNPHSGFISDAAGNFYGSTYNGGSGSGTVYELAAGSHTLTTLASFNGSNGSHPKGNLLMDGLGNLYGTTYNGGSGSEGTVFEIAAGSHTVTTLANFNGSNGAYPFDGLASDSAGNLYGTTSGNALLGGTNDGTVFEISAGSHTFSTLVTFNGANGELPQGAVIVDAVGDLFGTTAYGSSNVFEVAAGSHMFTSRISNTNNSAGVYANTSLTADSAGNLYGIDSEGRNGAYGAVFEITNSGYVPVPEPVSLSGLVILGLGLSRRRTR